jgi:MYXO-CTERM domain-containing protein
LALGVCLAGACGQLPAQATSTDEPIFGGTPDTEHGAVMALIDQISATTASACSGTTIALQGASGIFLTAAHCVVANNGMGQVTTPIQVASPSSLFLVPGPDWQTNVHNGLFYGIAQVAVHPNYNGMVDSPFDIAVVRFLGALPATPVIPALAPTEDNLAVGTPITIVGFGKTETNAMNSTRYEVGRVIESITANEFDNDQSDGKGACQGDSGGPALVSTPAGLRVAGVTSFGDSMCTKLGASVRVSPVYTSFILPFINAAPRALSCNDCALASVGPGNQCVNQSMACQSSTSPCGRFLACANGCSNQPCVTTCRHNNPAGASAFDAIVSCQCGGMCATPCASNPTCGGSGGGGGTSGGAGTSGVVGTGVGGTSGAAGNPGSFACSDFTDPRAACQTCLQQSCCSQATACANDGTCSSCLIETSSPACRLNSAFAKLTQCLANCPGTPCASSANPAGAAGSSGGTTGATGGKSGCGCDLDPGPSPAAGFVALLAIGFALARSRTRLVAPARRTLRR